MRRRSCPSFETLREASAGLDNASPPPISHWLYQLAVVGVK
jgi:hypothetical protein